MIYPWPEGGVPVSMESELDRYLEPPAAEQAACTVTS